MPDATWWDQQPEKLPMSREECWAEIRRLKHALVRVHDETDELTSPRGQKVHGIASEALGWKRPGA
ncbi:MAG: hypothetical protein JST54_14110 [Deltaproteobacteria bacterium]|nr:hypothetical protein [Deltaproteobacteria bacterium]